MNLDNILEAKRKLLAFEEDISSLYERKMIRAPVHLAGNNEEQLIKTFKNIQIDDWVCTSYRNHYHALLKGIPSDWIKDRILKGSSMFLMNREHKFFSSAIVPGQLPVALGIAQALKLQGSKNKVWAFCGDMAAESGVFYEVTKYAAGHKLPIKFVVEDDGLSVYTPTRDVWPASVFEKEPEEKIGAHSFPKTREENTDGAILRYKYKRKWPHHGIGLWIKYDEEEEKEPKYLKEIKRAMDIIGEDRRVVFIGQTTRYKGSPIHESLKDIPLERRIEVPIMEEVQMGMATGMALAGYVPVNIYPRFDFLILATNQLVNHLDKIREMSGGDFNPRVIIRTAVGSKSPLNGGPQHTQDHTEAYRKMLTNIDVVRLDHKDQIVTEYNKALKSERSTLLVEMADLYTK